MTKELAGKVAIVTGAGRNIGEEVAHTLAREGAMIAVVDLDRERAERVAADINAAGGKAKAFVCKAADCGTEVTVYIRAKIGFCNCSTGVADDEELDRISDFDLLGNQLTAQAAGQPITVAWMKGRSRAFSIGGPQRAAKSALSVGFNDR